MSLAAPAIDRPAATAAVAFLCAVAAVHLFVVPVTIGAAVDDLGFNEKQVGDALGIAGICYVLIVLTSPFWITRWNWRWVCGFALGLGTIATFGLTMASSYSAYVGLQIALSASLGLLFPPIMSALGSASEPDKKFGVALLVQSVLGAAAIYFLKALVAPVWGIKGVYGILTVFTTLGFIALFWIPDRAESTRPNQKTDSSQKHLIWIGLAALAIYMMSVNGFSSYSERFGEHFGLSGGLIAGALSLGVLLAAAGSAFVAVVGDHWGRVRPLLVSLGVVLVGYSILLGRQTEDLFVLAVCIINVSFGMTTAYAFATVSAVDTSGRYTGLMTAASGVGTAVAVTLLGRIITGHGYAAFTWALIIISTIAAALMIFVAQRAPARRERPEGGA